MVLRFKFPMSNSIPLLARIRLRSRQTYKRFSTVYAPNQNERHAL